MFSCLVITSRDGRSVYVKALLNKEINKPIEGGFREVAGVERDTPRSLVYENKIRLDFSIMDDVSAVSSL